MTQPRGAAFEGKSDRTASHTTNAQVSMTLEAVMELYLKGARIDANMHHI